MARLSMTRWGPLLVAGLAACSSQPLRIGPNPLANPTDLPPERFIIAAVDSEPVAFVARAGGTPRAYDAISTYGPTSSAIKTLHTVEDEYGLREVNAWPINPLHMHCAVLEIPEGTDRASLVARLSGDPRIRLAQPLQSFATRTGDYNDPYVDLQRGFQRMDVGDAHSWSRGEGVKVAIIDTGADTEHPDLRGRIAATDNFVDADAVQFRSDRHGTEMAGVIAAVANNREGIVGIAPGARLLVFKACWQVRADADAARCNSFTLARALVAALDAHAQVINLSLAGPKDPLLSELIREGLRRGVLFVGAAASGPTGGESLLHQPGVIEVASEESDTRASLLYAPGHEILTLMPGGHYDFATGDSIATAQVTGVVALLLEKNHGLSAAAAGQVLRETSTGTGAAGASEHVDACGAVVALLGRGSCPAAVAAAHRAAVPENRVALH